MKFYIDACLPREVTDEIRKRDHNAVYAMDLGFAHRDDQFHIEQSRTLRRILVTKDQGEFKRNLNPKSLRGHPGIVVLIPPSGADTARILAEIDNMFFIFNDRRIGAKPPNRKSLRERLLVISQQEVYFQGIEGKREDWSPSTG